jgi:hypothetical protein
MTVGKGDVDRVVADRRQPVDGDRLERRGERSIDALARAPRAPAGRAQARALTSAALPSPQAISRRMRSLLSTTASGTEAASNGGPSLVK